SELPAAERTAAPYGAAAQLVARVIGPRPPDPGSGGRGLSVWKEDTLRVGILGSGLMGGKLGTLFARAGHEVVFSYARSEQKLKRLARGAGKRARAGTPAHAARESDVLLLAVHWTRVNDVLKQAGALRSKTVVSCSLPMNASDTALVVAHTSSGAEVLARWLRGAHFVSAFGTVPSAVLFDVFEGRRRSMRPSILYCGDNPRAKDT